MIQRLIGHSPTSVTDRYTHHQSTEKLREWLEKLPWLMDKVAVPVLDAVP